MAESLSRRAGDAVPRPARPSGVVRAPRLPRAADQWLNGVPTTDWRGRVTLVDFWTYSCINCLRTLPALRAWHAHYAAHGLAIIGVHTPEFPFERERINVARALDDLQVAYPVVQDNDRAIWSSFANRCWPHRYLIDATGRIVHDHAGEGGEVATERALRAALAALPAAPSLPPPIFATPDDWDDRNAGAPGAVCLPGTPELFAGYYRGVSGNPGGFREDEVAAYTDPGDYREGYLHLQGSWRVEADAAHFVGPGPGYLRVAFRGTAPNLVLAPVSGDVTVAHAGIGDALTATPAAASGLPLGVPLAVDRPRLYPLPTTAWQATARAGSPDALRLLTLVPAAPGLLVYSLTFGACG